MTVPPRVHSWWEEFDFMTPDVRDDLGRLVSQLECGLSPTATSEVSDQPSGWSGVARRGPWSRLLPSEWALAEIAPEEFLRRAGEGELAFWELGQESSQQNHSASVWLDVGPDQLGACRLVQIAILLWLQRRCRRSGGQMSWATIQSPEMRYQQLRAEELKIYLNSRSMDLGRRPPETSVGVATWCVGSAGWIAQVPRGFRRLVLTQRQEDRVELKVDDADRPLVLRLPPSRRAVRLLRDPLIWGLPRQPAASRAGQGQLVFSECGRKLLFVTDTHISVLPIPNSINEPPGRLRHYRLLWTGTVVAVSMQGQAINVVQAQRGFWNFYWLNPPTADRSHKVQVVAPKKVPDRLGTCWKRWPSRWRLWVDDVLYQVEEEGLKVLERTRGGTELGNSSLLSTDRGEVINAFNQSLHTFTQPWPQRVCLAPRYPLQVSAVGQALATLRSDGTWRLCWLESAVDLDIAGEVLGLVRTSKGGLAILVNENGRLWLQGPDWREVVDLGEKLDCAVLHPKGLLAYRTRSGGAGVYSFEDGCRRWVAAP